jgi:cysteinyl-tRNA synthetase
LNFTQEALGQAQASRQRLLDFILALEGITRTRPAEPSLPRLIAESRRSFTEALGDDLNIAEALAALFEFIRAANTLIGAEALGTDDARRILEFLGELDAVLGILPPKTKDLLPEEVQKNEVREEARRAGNFRPADDIRRTCARVKLEDTKDGVAQTGKKDGPTP